MPNTIPWFMFPLKPKNTLKINSYVKIWSTRFGFSCFQRHSMAIVKKILHAIGIFNWVANSAKICKNVAFLATLPIFCAYISACNHIVHNFERFHMIGNLKLNIIGFTLSPCQIANFLANLNFENSFVILISMAKTNKILFLSID